MPGKGWFNLEAASGVIPDTQFFEGESAFSFLGLTRTQRLYGFAGCLVGGFILSIIAASFLFLGWLSSFAILYAVGTIISLAGTGFLIGFLTQLKLMFKPVRVIATIVFLAMIGLIFCGSVRDQNRLPLSDLRYPRIPGLCVVFTLIHPIRQNGCA